MESYKTTNELEKFARKSLSKHRYNLSINTIDEEMAFIFGFYQGAKLWIPFSGNEDILVDMIYENADCLLMFDDGSVRRYNEDGYPIAKITHFMPIYMPNNI